MDERLRTAVDASVGWYDDICTSHGIESSIEAGLWFSHTPPPPLHSAAKPVEPWVRPVDAMRAIERFEHCSVADSFASLNLGVEGMDLLFSATWLHRGPLADTRAPMPPGWAAVATPGELTEWNAHHDTAGVLLPGLLERSRFRILARREGGEMTAGAVAQLGTGAVYLSNVWASPAEDVARGGTGWEGMLRAVHACFPGRPMVGYEQGEDLVSAMAAGFSAIGEHRVWAR